MSEGGSMKVWKILAALWVAVFMVMGEGALRAHAGEVGSAVTFNRECRYGLGVVAMRKTVRCVADRLEHVATSTALAVAYRESKFYAHARNPSSGTCGIYQHQPHLWPGRYRAFSPPFWGRMPSSCYSGRANIIVSLSMVNRAGWGPWE